MSQEFTAMTPDVVYGKPLSQWLTDFPLFNELLKGEPTHWFNPRVAPLAEALSDISLTAVDVADASARLARFAPYLAQAFPEVAGSAGVIESPLVATPAFAEALAARYGQAVPNVLLKLDSHLPISGSVKARGGIYEVLYTAERLAVEHGLLKLDSDYRELLQPAARALFARHKIAVGSTGNLGLSIGIAAARLGFATTVHMSADAREWKKAKLRSHGVTVVEHPGDYGEAVKKGRAEADADPACHFVDDENSTALFLGYAVAGERLKAQFEQKGIVVDAEHPLYVYLPCGVGGGPGGIAFGLKLAFGDNVHCVFAEPTQSPCMFMGVYTGLHDELAVQDFGISNHTAADGLAVGRPSGFVGRAMQRMIDGYYTVTDDELFSVLALLQSTERIELEPSALAGAPGFKYVQNPQATHLIWATGGGMVPADEMAKYLARGREQ